MAYTEQYKNLSSLNSTLEGKNKTQLERLISLHVHCQSVLPSHTSLSNMACSPRCYTDCCFDFEYFGWAMIGAAGGKAANFTGMLGKTIDANVLLTPSGDETVH